MGELLVSGRVTLTVAGWGGLLQVGGIPHSDRCIKDP